MDFEARLSRVAGILKETSADALLVTNENNVSYLSGFKGQDSMLLLTDRERYFITDFRYMEEALNSVKGFEIIMVKKSTYDTMAELCRAGRRIRNLAFESMNLPYEVAARLKNMLKKSTRLMPFKNIVECLRQIKDAEEVAVIKKAASLTKAIYGNFLKSVRIGRSETYLASRLKIGLMAAGAACAFEPIVAIDRNASRPHAVSGAESVKKGSFIMVDFGAKLDGYNSDLTRMVMPSGAGLKIRKLYDIVKKAKDLAIKRIAPGVRASDVDRAARGFIRRNGFGKYFGHALGHGVGLDVHEAPSIGWHNDKPLKEGMVFTVEPAIYIPKFGGIRIEDMVVVTKKGCEVITGG